MAQRIIQLAQVLLILCSAHLCLGAPDTNGQNLQLVPRQSKTCQDPEFLHCGGDPAFPDDFCCPPTSSCINIDRSHEERTIICCPEGFKCTRIRPITCQVTYQNATYDPSSLIKSERLSDDLPQCGDSCCPHGYTCQENESCRLIEEEAKTFSYTSTSTSAATATASGSESDSATAETSTPTTSTEVIPMASCPEFSRNSIVIGFFPGMAAGFILAAISYCGFKKYRNRISPSPSPRGSSPVPAHQRQRSNASRNVPISEPIPTNIQDSVRTDFLRQMPADENTHERAPSRLARTGARVRSFFTPTPRPTDPDPPPIPVTPPNQVYSRRRERSSENLRRYGGLETSGRERQPSMLQPNPHFRESRPTTTFTDMMERVGFQNDRGSPFYQVTTTPQPHTRK